MKAFGEQGDYEHLTDEESNDGGLEKRDSHPSWLSARIVFVGNILIFAISMVCLLATSVLYRKSTFHNDSTIDQMKLLESTLSFSQIIQPPIPLKITRFTSAPLSSRNDSIYRQPPNPEVDAAWDRLADIGTHILPSSDIIKLGKDTGKAVRLPESWGYGPDANIATLDGIHLVHCLNSMRQSLHPFFAYYHPNPLGPEYLPHLMHCVEAVLKHLMCNPSLEFLTQNWIERQHEPFPDFAVNKKCWDYEALLAWKDANRVLDVEKRFEELKPPVGMVREPLPPLVAETWEIIDGYRNHTS